MKRKLVAAVILFAASAALCSVSSASLLKFMSARELVAESDLAALCAVLSKTVKTEGNIPYTYTEVELLDVYSGAASKGDVVVVRQRGGLTGEYYVKTIGDAELVEGAKYALFLSKSGGQYVLSGMAQAAFKVYKTAEGAEMIENKDETPRLDPATGKIVSTPIMPPKPLAQFVKEIKQIVAELKAAKTK